MTCLINSIMCHSVRPKQPCPVRAALQPRAPLGHLWVSGTGWEHSGLCVERKTCPAAQMWTGGLDMESPTLQCIDNPKRINPILFQNWLVFYSSVQVFQQKFCCHVHVLPRRNCPSSPKAVTSHLSFAKLSIYTTSLTKALHSHWLEVLVWFGLRLCILPWS